jgi:hypothetical protein
MYEIILGRGAPRHQEGSGTLPLAINAIGRHSSMTDLMIILTSQSERNKVGRWRRKRCSYTNYFNGFLLQKKKYQQAIKIKYLTNKSTLICNFLELFKVVHEEGNVLLESSVKTSVKQPGAFRCMHLYYNIKQEYFNGDVAILEYSHMGLKKVKEMFVWTTSGEPVRFHGLSFSQSEYAAVIRQCYCINILYWYTWWLLTKTCFNVNYVSKQLVRVVPQDGSTIQEHI